MEREHGERKRLTMPKPGGSVWPKDFCPAFSPREGWLPIEKEPKSFTGNRYIDFSNFVAEKIIGKKISIQTCNGRKIKGNGYAGQFVF